MKCSYNIKFSCSLNHDAVCLLGVVPNTTLKWFVVSYDPKCVSDGWSDTSRTMDSNTHTHNTFWWLVIEGEG